MYQICHPPRDSRGRDRRNSSQERIALGSSLFRRRCCTSPRRRIRCVARLHARTHTYTCLTVRHTLTDTKTSESLDKLPARKSIGHSRALFGGARRSLAGAETNRKSNGEGVGGVAGDREQRGRGRGRGKEREALRTGYIPDWFRYCSR